MSFRNTSRVTNCLDTGQAGLNWGKLFAKADFLGFFSRHEQSDWAHTVCLKVLKHFTRGQKQTTFAAIGSLWVNFLSTG